MKEDKLLRSETGHERRLDEQSEDGGDLFGADNDPSPPGSQDLPNRGQRRARNRLQVMCNNFHLDG